MNGITPPPANGELYVARGPLGREHPVYGRPTDKPDVVCRLAAAGFKTRFGRLPEDVETPEIVVPVAGMCGGCGVVLLSVWDTFTPEEDGALWCEACAGKVQMSPNA